MSSSTWPATHIKYFTYVFYIIISELYGTIWVFTLKFKIINKMESFHRKDGKQFRQ